MKKLYSPPPGNKTLSGGIRVVELGLIELLVDADVIHGMHNEPFWTRRMLCGERFNSLHGEWYDVIPDFEEDAYFRRIGDSVPYTEIEAHNKKIRQ